MWEPKSLKELFGDLEDAQQRARAAADHVDRIMLEIKRRIPEEAAEDFLSDREKQAARISGVSLEEYARKRRLLGAAR